MGYTTVGQFDNRTLLPGMDYDMMGAFVETESGNKYVYPWDWVLKDSQTGLFIVMKDEEYQRKYVINKNKINMSDTTQELSFGQKAAGVDFNPGGHETVNSIKAKFAAIIDEFNDLRNNATSGDAKRYYSKAISYAEDSQMNGVKAATWKH